MNSIHIKSKLFAFIMVCAGVFSFISCNPDKETEVTPKTLEAYHTELSQLVSSEKAKVETTVVGYNKGDFKGEQFFTDYAYDYMRTIILAENVLADPEVTIADIFKANRRMTGPGKLFNDLIFLSDRRELNNLVGVCDTLYVHTPAGTEPGMAPEEDRALFKADINSAKSVRDRMTSIDRQITEAVDALTISLEVFNEAIIK